MIYVIVPLGKEAKDVRDWVGRVFMYAAASTLGAAILAFILAFVGKGLRAVLPFVTYPWAVALLGIASMLYALHELNIIHMPTKELAWLVPKVWMRRSRLLGNTLYGLVLGAGIFTFIPFTSFYILLSWEIVAGAVSLKAALTLGMLYGASRGIPSVLGGISMLRGSYPLPVTNWLIQRLGWWHAINGIVLLFVGCFLLGSFVL